MVWNDLEWFFISIEAVNPQSHRKIIVVMSEIVERFGL